MPGNRHWAAASGHAAVRVVDHVIERLAPVSKASPTAAQPTAGGPTFKRTDDWVNLLDQLTRRLETGLIYNRDLAALRPSMERLVAAYNRREDDRRWVTRLPDTTRRADRSALDLITGAHPQHAVVEVNR